MEEHFRFYYSRDREAIKAMLIKKRKEERESKKMAKKAKKAEKKAKKMKTITNEEGKEIEFVIGVCLISVTLDRISEPNDIS